MGLCDCFFFWTVSDRVSVCRCRQNLGLCQFVYVRTEFVIV